MTSPEDTARRFERRQGYDLIDYAPVALPLYRLVIDVVTMAHRPIPPIKEFVMRSIAAGLVTEGEVAGFLGLDEAVASAVFQQLSSERYATLDTDGHAALSERGTKALAQARESSPQDEMLVLLYDRLLCKPVRVAPQNLLAPSAVDPAAVVEIRPYPAEGPDVAALPLAEVSQVLAKQVGGFAAFARDLLKIKRIVRRTRLYRPGVAMVYKKSRGSEVQIAFAVDDVRDEALENTFAERGGPKKMGFVRSVNESNVAADLRRYLGLEVQRLLPDAAALNERRLAVSVARVKLQAALARQEREGGPGEGSEPLPEVQALVASLGAAESDLRAFAARPVAPYELVELLGKALDECETMLLVTSRDIVDSVLNGTLVRRVEAALKRGVQVTIALSDAPSPDPKGPAVQLERLRNRHPKLELTSGRTGSVQHLVCDEKFAVVCNRPFLGNSGKVRTFEHVSGYLIQSTELVRAFARKVQPAIVRGGRMGIEAQR